MSRIKRPSPALVVAILALVAAIAVPAFALTKKEKRVVKKIANAQITKRAPGLSVASAQNANTANSAATADSATTAESANSLDGAEFCRTDGVLTLDDDDPEQVLCQQGAISVQTFCNASGPNTGATLRFVTTTGGTFLRSPVDNVASTATFQIMVAATVTDAPGGGPTVSTGPGDFAGGVPSTGDQLSGVATTRAEALAADEGTCDFILGGI